MIEIRDVHKRFGAVAPSGGAHARFPAAGAGNICVRNRMRQELSGLFDSVTPETF
ncbi:hypothetical protein NB716_002481 [Pantoea ananatis]|nr:hypothetical protein [Pantoea ananatis]